mmetsp:Transcript_12127/g.28018  ORF Transcript_12127/g.28018 Transcript_12127/m.28018 type:complete len:207 (+) Transcript_12127:407-1027(+)
MIVLSGILNSPMKSFLLKRSQSNTWQVSDSCSLSIHRILNSIVWFHSGLSDFLMTGVFCFDPWYLTLRYGSDEPPASLTARLCPAITRSRTFHRILSCRLRSACSAARWARCISLTWRSFALLSLIVGSASSASTLCKSRTVRPLASTPRARMRHIPPARVTEAMITAFFFKSDPSWNLQSSWSPWVVSSMRQYACRTLAKVVPEV